MLDGLEYDFISCFFYKYLKSFDIKVCIADAEKGQPVEQAMLAHFYAQGLFGLKSNEKKALALAKKSAKQDCPDGLTALAECYMIGIGTEIDEKKAFDLLLQAAKFNCIRALYQLGRCYICGIGTPVDEKEGINTLLFTIKREPFCWKAYEFLENYYISSSDIFTPVMFFQLCKKGSFYGHYQSQTMLGYCYKMGVGTPADEKKAFNIIRKVVKKSNYGLALHYLACFYNEGTVVEKNSDKAAEYEKLAIENGYNEEGTYNSKTLADYYKEQQSDEKRAIKLAADNKLPPITTNLSKAINYKNDKNNVPDYVVYIENIGIGSGTGFIINPNGYVATSAHVVVDDNDIVCESIYIKDNSNRIFQAAVVKINNETDVAILKINCADKFPYAACELDREVSPLDEPVALYGYPMGVMLSDDVLELNMSVTKGYISSNQKKWGLKLTMLDIAARHGNSGGPVISCETGKVIGLLKGAVPGEETDEVNYMCPICYLRDLIKEPNYLQPGVASPAMEEERLFKSWGEVKRFLKKKYIVNNEESDWMSFLFELENQRSQIVVVEVGKTESGEQWITISSRIGLLKNKSLDSVLEEIGECCYGGLIKQGDKHFLRYSVLLTATTERSLTIPIESFVSFADGLEEKYLGIDES